MKFNDNFDWDTLFYDAVRLAPRELILIGPPLYRMKHHLRKEARFVDQHGETLSQAVYELDRVCLTVIRSTNKYSIDKLSMITPTEITDIQINPRSTLFENQRVLITLQRDNPVAWMRQWMDYHEVNHRITAFLIYDNNSFYRPELIDEFCGKPGRTIVVVCWPFPYGPQGIDSLLWDSDFCQYGMLEHAKYRYVYNADLVINGDIDELLLSDRDISDIVTLNGGIVSHGGFWVSPYSLSTGVSACDIAQDQRQYGDYAGVDETRNLSNRKWIVDPKLCDRPAQWQVHQISGQRFTRQVSYAHFMATHTNWSQRRDTPRTIPQSEHEGLRRALDNVWPE
jgi:hypothetical protein